VLNAPSHKQSHPHPSYSFEVYFQVSAKILLQQKVMISLLNTITHLQNCLQMFSPGNFALPRATLRKILIKQLQLT